MDLEKRLDKSLEQAHKRIDKHTKDTVKRVKELDDNLADLFFRRE